MKSAAGLVAAVAALALVATVAVVWAQPRSVLEQINSDAGTLPETGEIVARPHETTEMIYAQQHPVYTRCAKKVDMPEFVKLVRKTCGNIHELSTLAAPCRDTLAEKAKEFGCCWETVMNAYSQLDAQAHHSWRMWQGTLSGKAGITFDEHSCGDSMGEQEYKKLEDEVGDLKKTVEDQADEMRIIEGILLMSMGFFKGDSAQSLKAVKGLEQHIRPAHAPFSAGDVEAALNKVQNQAHTEEKMVRQQMAGRRAAHTKHVWHNALKGGSPLNFFLQDAKGDSGVRKMREAGVKV